MKANRNDVCPCGSEKKYKKCCWNWREKWAAGIDRYECDQEIKDIIRGTYDFIAEHDYRGGCHTISAIMHILLTEKGFNSIVRLGEVQIDRMTFDHSWIDLDGKVIDMAIMNTLQDGIKIPPVIFGESVSTKKQVEYRYGVSQNIDRTAQVVLNMSIGNYLMGGVEQGTLAIMRIIAENANISFDNIEETVKKYSSIYRVKSVASV